MCINNIGYQKLKRFSGLPYAIFFIFCVRVRNGASWLPEGLCLLFVYCRLHHHFCWLLDNSLGDPGLADVTRWQYIRCPTALLIMPRLVVVDCDCCLVPSLLWIVPTGAGAAAATAAAVICHLRDLQGLLLLHPGLVVPAGAGAGVGNVKHLEGVLLLLHIWLPVAGPPG